MDHVFIVTDVVDCDEFVIEEVTSTEEKAIAAIAKKRLKRFRVDGWFIDLPPVKQRNSVQGYTFVMNRDGSIQHPMNKIVRYETMMHYHFLVGWDNEKELMSLELYMEVRASSPTEALSIADKTRLMLIEKNIWSEPNKDHRQLWNG